MPNSELPTTLNLKQLTQEQRLKITQGIVDDLVRALNLGNYSLIWRYFSDDYNVKHSPEDFSSLQQQLLDQYGHINIQHQIESTETENQLQELWQISTETEHTLHLKLTFIPIKEFLAIDSFSVEANNE